MTRRVCQSCLDEGCNGIACYFATSEPKDEETTSTVTLDELMRSQGMGASLRETGSHAAHEAPAGLRPSGFDPARIAALFVETGGCYFGLPGVDPWDIHRDARKYRGPYPVVAHPPCDRWHQLSAVNHKRWGFTINEDDGCFAFAVDAVRKWGGVLEHPAESRAFKFHGIPEPSRGWQQTIDGDWTTEVDQAAYGHRARKRTWLLYSGDHPPFQLDLRETRGSHQIGLFDRTKPVMAKQEALETPLAFRDLLLDLARTAKAERLAA